MVNIIKIIVCVIKKALQICLNKKYTKRSHGRLKNKRH